MKKNEYNISMAETANKQKIVTRTALSAHIKSIIPLSRNAFGFCCACVKPGLIIFAAIFTLIAMTACAENGGINIATEVPVGGGLRTAAVIADFSAGSVEEDIKQSTHYSYEDIKPEELADFLSSWTGLDFTVSITYKTDTGAMIVDWAADSTLVANLDDREQKEEFHFYEADSLRWFMMDSLWRTLTAQFGGEVYYTMNGGQELAFEELYPVSNFPVDIPYMGSPFYFAHADIRGEDDPVGGYYYDEKYSLELFYPDIFASSGTPNEMGGMNFVSLQDDAVLQYWVMDRTDDDLLERNGVSEYIDNENGSITALAESMNQETGQIGYFAYFWVTDPGLYFGEYGDNRYVCVAIVCTTAESAKNWYNMLKNGSVSVGSLSEPKNSESISIDDEGTAMDLLSEAIADRLVDGTALVSYGEEVINGTNCWIFAYGKNTPEKFTAEERYAVSKDGSILIYDLLNNEYNLLN